MIQLQQLRQICFNESLSCRGEGGCVGKGGPLWSPAAPSPHCGEGWGEALLHATDLLKIVARHSLFPYIVGATLAVALGWKAGL